MPHPGVSHLLTEKKKFHSFLGVLLEDWNTVKEIKPTFKHKDKIESHGAYRCLRLIPRGPLLLTAALLLLCRCRAMQMELDYPSVGASLLLEWQLVTIFDGEIDYVLLVPI